MQRIILLKEVESHYKNAVQQHIDSNGALTPDAVIDLSLTLFHTLKIKGISTEADKESDMLLFQYGTYNWGDKKGKHFSFDITRQFIKTSNDQMYQLSFTLVFDSHAFSACGSYNSWSSSFGELNEWAANIKCTEGYQLAKSVAIRSCEIDFDEL